MIWFLIVAAATIIAIQWWLIQRFQQYLSVDPAPRIEPRFEPYAVVILCARGADPHLGACLQGLAGQDWPKYRVIMVCDDASDPAIEVFQNVASTQPRERFELRVVQDRPPNRSLKCNSLLEACSSLEPEVDAIALIDADVIPNSQWLRRLIAPLSNDSTAATWGMRWFEPPGSRPGANIRSIWNAAAIVQMQAYAIPWGGSLAVRRRALEMASVMDAWQAALFEDVLISPKLAAVGLRVAFCPHVFAVNREETSWYAAARWITRQLLDVRLYHPRWPLVFAHALGNAGLALLLFGSGFFLMVVGRPVDGLLCWIALAAFQLANRWLLFKIYRAVDSVMPISARPLPFQGLNWMGQIALITATQLTHIGAAISVLLKKSVRWRGIDYRVAAPFRIDMARYQPIRDTTSFKPGADRATESIV